ncbi:MAG: thioredoxin fold domain-containing protein [Armatimonadetes bacterium]|nr:thioredoxin fold domain-containing protein [Armatimonadota bacterium]
MKFPKIAIIAAVLIAAALIVSFGRHHKPSPKVAAENIQDVLKALAASQPVGKPVVLEFYADWCTACTKMKPTLTELESRYKGKVFFAFLNVDDAGNTPLVEKYGVRAIPNVLFFDPEGRMTEQLVGAQDKKRLEDSLERATARK